MSGIYDVNLLHTRWTRCARQRGSGAGAAEPPCGQWTWSAGQPPSGSPPGQGNHRHHAAGQVNAVHVFCGVVKLSFKERYSLWWGTFQKMVLPLGGGGRPFKECLLISLWEEWESTFERMAACV